MSEPFRITVLCTANRFRSPLAAGLIRAHTATLPVEVRSAAVSGRDGAPALPEALALAPRLGIDLGGHASRRLGRAELSDADLVLGFERTHVAAAVVEGGADRARTFTLPELVSLAEDLTAPEGADPVARARSVVARAARRRGPGGPPLDLPELADPVGGPPAGFEDAARRVGHLSGRLVRVLFGRSTAGPAPAGRDAPPFPG